MAIFFMGAFLVVVFEGLIGGYWNWNLLSVFFMADSQKNLPRSEKLYTPRLEGSGKRQ